MSAERPPSDQVPEIETRRGPSVYIASLSDYNAGRLYGSWIDADQEADALHAAISDMMAGSPTPGAEEWAIHDYEGFGQLRLSEYESIERVADLARRIVEHGPAFAAWAAQLDPAAELARFAECFLGRWQSIEEYVEELLDELGVTAAVEAAAGSFAPYVRVDAEAFSRDLVLGGDVVAVDAPEGGVFLFLP